MEKDELAKILNGRQYNQEVTSEEAMQAFDSGLVIVFGRDNLVVFRGTITGAVECSTNTVVKLNSKGIIDYPKNFESCSQCEYFEKRTKDSIQLTAVWNHNEFSWSYRIPVEHSEFIIYEGGIPYCKGIIFKLSDLK